MRQFFKYVLATITGVIILGFISTVLLVLLVAGLASSDKTITVAKDSVLELRLDKPLGERGFDNPLPGFVGGQASTHRAR